MLLTELVEIEFLSTPSARRATLVDMGYFDDVEISIHALREEGDQRPPLLSRYVRHFYPRPPRGGRRPEIDEPMTRALFLSTPSARRAT